MHHAHGSQVVEAPPRHVSQGQLLPNAVLIEYIPNMKIMDLSTFSPSRMQKFTIILNEMHEAKIYHRDVYPRNMKVVPGSPDRILWVDFDRSQTYLEPLTQEQEGWIRSETRAMDEFARMLVSLMTSLQYCASSSRIHCRLQTIRRAR